MFTKDNKRHDFVLKVFYFFGKYYNVDFTSITLTTLQDSYSIETYFNFFYSAYEVFTCIILKQLLNVLHVQACMRNWQCQTHCNNWYIKSNNDYNAVFDCNIVRITIVYKKSTKNSTQLHKIVHLAITNTKIRKWWLFDFDFIFQCLKRKQLWISVVRSPIRCTVERTWAWKAILSVTTFFYNCMICLSKGFWIFFISLFVINNNI